MRDPAQCFGGTSPARDRWRHQNGGGPLSYCSIGSRLCCRLLASTQLNWSSRDASGSQQAAPSRRRRKAWRGSAVQRTRRRKPPRRHRPHRAHRPRCPRSVPTAPLQRKPQRHTPHRRDARHVVAPVYMYRAASYSSYQIITILSHLIC